MCYVGKAYIKDNTKNKICNDKKVIQMINNTINYLNSNNRLPGVKDDLPKMMSLLTFDDENYAVVVDQEDDNKYKCTINAYFDSSDKVEDTYYHKSIEFCFNV